LPPGSIVDCSDLIGADDLFARIVVEHGRVPVNRYLGARVRALIAERTRAVEFDAGERRGADVGIGELEEKQSSQLRDFVDRVVQIDDVPSVMRFSLAIGRPRSSAPWYFSTTVNVNATADGVVALAGAWHVTSGPEPSNVPPASP